MSGWEGWEEELACESQESRVLRVTGVDFLDN